MPLAGKSSVHQETVAPGRLPVAAAGAVLLTLLFVLPLSAQAQIPASLFGLNPDTPQAAPQRSSPRSPTVETPMIAPLPPRRPLDATPRPAESGVALSNSIEMQSQPIQAQRFERVKPPRAPEPVASSPDTAASAVRAVTPEPQSEPAPPTEDVAVQPVEQPAAAPQVAVPLPPPAPANRLPSASSPATSAPVDVGLPPSIASVAPLMASGAPVSNLSERQIIERANRYFNTMDTMTAIFTQVGGEGRRMTGTLYLQRPGRLRFAYDPPATLEIVADGKSVAVRDSKLKTSDVYSIDQTPLKFLLRDPINLASDLKIIDIEKDPTGVQITLEDNATLGGKSQITLFFDQQVQNLTRWRVVDAQGFVTTVILSRVERTKRGG